MLWWSAEGRLALTLTQTLTLVIVWRLWWFLSACPPPTTSHDELQEKVSYMRAFHGYTSVLMP